MPVNILANIDKYKLPIALSILGIVLIIGGIFASGINSQSSSSASKQDFPKESLVQTTKMISIDVSGAVANPGVYQLKDGSRIEDAIKIANGFSENVNLEFVSKNLNMAQKLSDGSKVYVPSEGEQASSSYMGTVAGATSKAKVNINTSSQSEIETLPGIGPVTASKIINGRPYQQIEDLFNKKIVSKAVFEKIKDSVGLY